MTMSNGIPDLFDSGSSSLVDGDNFVSNSFLEAEIERLEEIKTHAQARIEALKQPEGDSKSLLPAAFRAEIRQLYLKHDDKRVTHGTCGEKIIKRRTSLLQKLRLAKPDLFNAGPDYDAPREITPFEEALQSAIHTHLSPLLSKVIGRSKFSYRFHDYAKTASSARECIGHLEIGLRQYHNLGLDEAFDSEQLIRSMAELDKSAEEQNIIKIG